MLVPADCTLVSEGFLIRTSFLDELEDIGPRWKLLDGQHVAGVLKSPLNVYEDLGRPGCDGAKCYTGKPGYRHDNDGAQIPMADPWFFLVYTDPLSGGEVVWDWGWRPADPDHPDHPLGWESFKKGNIWPL